MLVIELAAVGAARGPRALLLPLWLACALWIAAQSDGAKAASLLPTPTSTTTGAGSLVLGASSRIVAANSSLADAAGVLANEVYSITGKRLQVALGEARDGDIVLQLDNTLAGESYTYNVGSRAVLSANSYQNVALASSSIVQSLTNSTSGWSLPNWSVADSPSARYRSTMYDLARNPHSIDSIKRQISLNRLYKIPYMQLHLTDDQAFTFATNSVSGVNGHGGNSTTYSQDELRSLVKWADQRGVTLIPELDVPSHSTQLVANRPDLFNTGTSSLANIANPAAVAAIKGIVGEMAGVFSSSPYIHIGGDEANYSHLAYKGATTLPTGVRAQWNSKMESLGDYTPEAVFRDFANVMNAYVKSLGKKTIMWESSSILNTTTPVDKDIVVMAYENTFTSSPSNYINAGFKVINASWSPLYVVGFNGSNNGLADSLSDIYNWDKTWFDVYYGFQNSTSAKQVTSNTDAILGGQMCFWENTQDGELGAGRQRVAAMAAKLWNPNSGASYADFLAQLTASDALLDSVIAGDAMALPNVVPEPNALALTLIGLGMVLLRTLGRSRVRTVVGALAAFMLGVAPAFAVEPWISVIPAPKQCELRDGAMRVTNTSQLVAAQTDAAPVTRLLATEIRQLTSLSLATADKPAASGDIVVELDPTMSGEQYSLEVDENATLRAGNAAAAAQGAASLLQLLRKGAAGVEIPKMTIHDEPALAYRGAMVDCARGPHSAATLKQIIVLCHWYKIRYLQLHLTDDQAFTFPSAAYPKLWAKCHHYTIKELRELEAFAGQRGVTLIPELDVPGHATSLVQPMPELFGTRPAPKANESGQAICVGRERAYQALDTLVGEMCDVFRASPYFHIGGDEVDYRLWRSCADTRAYMAANKIDSMEELYRRFLVRMNEIVKKHGRKTLVWEGFAKSGKTEIPRDITVMVFESKYNLPPDLLAGGYKIINAAWQPLYITPGRRWSPEYIYGWNHYRWESCWDVSAAFKNPIVVRPTPDVLGAQLCSWEQGEGGELPSLRDRLPAMSERIWNPTAGKKFADFARRFKATDAALEQLLKSK